MLTDLKKNKQIALQIEKMLESDRTIHAFLFYGGSIDSRNDLGMWLAERILCNDEISTRKFAHGNHEDFIVVDKPEDRESILKDQILELNQKLSFKPFGDKYAVLIKNANLMNTIAQNKLLKGLEEPVAPSVFILLSETEDSLLPTIRSRCSSFCLEEEPGDLSEESRNAARLFAELIKQGPCYYKKKNVIAYILADKDNNRDLSLNFLEALEIELERAFLSGDKRCADAILHVENAIMYIKQLQSVAYTLKQLCLRT